MIYHRIHYFLDEHKSETSLGICIVTAMSYEFPYIYGQSAFLHNYNEGEPNWAEATEAAVQDTKDAIVRFTNQAPSEIQFEIIKE